MSTIVFGDDGTRYNFDDLSPVRPDGVLPTQTRNGTPRPAPDGEPERRSRLQPRLLSEIRADVAARPPRRWALEGIWIEGTPLLIGAEEKAGKTVALADLAVSLASGTPWMNTFPVCAPGPVLAFFAEDDDAEMVRRIDGICADRGIDPDSLDIRLEFIPPNLSNAASLNEVSLQLEAHPAVAVILDPLYLSIGEDGDGSDLNKMGQVLSRYGETCRAHGAAPVVIAHWNKTGKGTGSDRITGTGLTQWARTIVSMSVRKQPVKTVVEAEYLGRAVLQDRVETGLRFEFRGNSVVPQEVQMERKMWALDRDDLNCPLHYEIRRVLAEEEAATGHNPLSAVHRALAAITALGGWVSAYEAQQWDAKHLPAKQDGSLTNPLKQDTVAKALTTLAGEGSLRSNKRGRENVFSLPAGEEAVEEGWGPPPPPF